MRNKLIILLIALLLFTSCKKKEKYKETIFGFFDTYIEVIAKSESKAEFKKEVLEIEKKLKYYHKLFDIYNNYEGLNNIKTINDNRGIKPVKVDLNIIELLEFSKEIYLLTQGLLDISIGNITNYIKANPDYSLKKLKEIKKSNINDIIIDKSKGEVFIKNKDTLIDVGSIAKGFTLDKIVENLSENFLISVGGNIKGTKNNFLTSIKDPKTKKALNIKLRLNEMSIATTALYERGNHIVNPLNLEHENKYLSVSVIHKFARYADALSTSLFIASKERRNLIEKNIKDLDYLIIKKNDKIIYSKNFKKYKK